MQGINLMQGDCLERIKEIKDGSVDMVLTSPPYNIGKAYETVVPLREYVDWQSRIIRAVSSKLKNGGSICWQIGNAVIDGAVYPIDCLLFSAFIDAGLTPRNRIVWTFGHGLHCKRRFSGRHETILWFTKGNDYTFNLDAVRVPSKYPQKKYYKGPKKGMVSSNPLGKNPEDVWAISNVKHNHPEKTEHPCQYPEHLCDRLVLALTNKNDTVLDPFMGSGTTGVSSKNLSRSFIGIELDERYLRIAQDRIMRSDTAKSAIAGLTGK